MKTINSFRSKLLALTLALMASVSSFAYEFEYVNDFHIDGFGYKIISVNTLDDGEGYVSLIEIADCKKDVVIPKYVSYGDRGFHVTTFGMGSVVFTNDASSVVESITIPKTTNIINKNVLAGCLNLKTVVVDSENPYYDSRENCNAIITTSQNPYITPNTLIAGCKTTIIPNSVVEIGENAFYDCESLETITIPNSVTKIGQSAFNVCSTLSSITLSENLTEIGNWAFDDCNNLKEVICYAPQPPTISKYTFSDISPTVYVPENTVTIYQNAPYWMTFDIQPINAGPFNEKLLGTWRVVGGNEIISISDSIIVFKYLGLTQKYTASATQLTVERLWIPEEESFRWANCNYTLSNDTLWIDNFMPLLVATYPPTFGPITLVKVKHEDLFPTLWGLQRTGCTKTIGEDEYGTVWGSRSYLMQETQTTTIDGKQYIVFGDEYDRFALREENNKILLYSSILKKDLVLYDFTLEVGDSLPALYYELRAHDTMHQWLYIGDIVDYNKDDDGTILPAETFVVTDISTITLLDGKEYKKWTFDNGMEYVEGIGSFGTSYAWNDFYQLIANGPLYSDVHSQHLVCVSKNGKLLYQMDDAEMEQLETECLCEYNAEQKPEDLFPTLWGLQRTSCDEWYDGCGENKSYLFAPKEVKEINGKLYLKCGGVFLREEDSKVLIYSFPYEKDFVLYDYTLEVGGTLQNLGIDIYSFPELEYAAVVDYMAYEDYDVETDEFIIKKEPLGSKRVQEVSTITLLDGKEYKRWLFGNDWENGDYYIEGIGNVGGSFGGDYIDIANPYGTPIPTCYLGERLVCASKNGQLLYQMDEAEMERLGAECLCDYNRGPRKDNAKNGKIGGRPTPTQWNQLELDLREGENGNAILSAETFSYTLENDSIVTKGKTFYQLARQSTKDTATTKSSVGALHFGEDNRVYFLRDGHEYVLYDFTAEPGDTIEIFAGINNYPQETTYTHVVVDKDTTEDGACRMFLEVVFPDETTTATNAEKVWLAGLGSIDGIVHNAAQRTSDAHAAPSRSASSETQTSVMLCAWREDSCLYTTNHPEYDTFGCVYNQDPTAVENLTSPSSYQKIIHEGTLLILHEGKVYNAIGIQIK